MSGNKIVRLPYKRVEHQNTELPLDLCLEVIKKLGENKTQQQIAAEVGITCPDVCKILKTRNKIISNSMDNMFHKSWHCRRGKHYFLDRAVSEWFMMMRRFDNELTREDLIGKARTLIKRLNMEKFKPTLQWFRKWSRKHCIQTRSSMPVIDQRNNTAFDGNLLSVYRPEDIYTVSEIPMRHKALNDKSALSTPDYLTVLVSCNQSGVGKRPLLVVGKDTVPSLINMPCNYKTDKHCWMTCDIFVDWLLEFDKEMSNQSRRILLVLEDSPVHPREVERDLSNIKLSFLPPSEELCLPCDEGLSHDLKVHYSKELARRSELFPDLELSLMDCLHLLSKTWNQTPSRTIQSAFSRAGFQSSNSKFPVNYDDPMPGRAEVCDDTDLKCYGTLTDEEICDIVSALQNEESEIDTGINEFKCVEHIEVKSDSEVLQSLSILRRYIESCAVKDFRHYYVLETQVHDQMRKKHIEKLCNPIE